jgi:hypothetical protein
MSPGWALAATMALIAGSVSAEPAAKINPTNPQPTCAMCPGTYIPLTELESYTRKALDEKLLDQQVRDIDIGKANIGIGMVHRGKLDKPAPASVAEHDEISEVYHVISGAATLVLGPDILNRRRRPATGSSTALATTARRLGTAWPTRSRPAMSW